MGAPTAIRDQAIELGFDAVGIARAASVDGETDRSGANLDTYLKEGRHGTMGWMDNPRRRSPAALWPEAKSIVVAAMNYGPAGAPGISSPGHGEVAAYARGSDYHDVMKRRLKRLAGWIADEYGAQVKVFVDTAPVLEKPIAARAGVGWQGKHTNLLSRQYGSWLLLGEVFTTLALEPDAPAEDECGTCTRCLDICPTNAFPAPHQLDSRRCISYLTIEHKGHIPQEFRAPMGNRIFGCDDCLAVCPWNKFAQTAHQAALWPRIELTATSLADFAALDDDGFRKVFAGSSIKRTGRDRFVRNVLIAIGNSGDPTLLPRVRERMTDLSPLVRAMAVWAYARLDPVGFADERTIHLDGEADEAVRDEWQALMDQPKA